jgi:hypothetical protein
MSVYHDYSYIKVLLCDSFETVIETLNDITLEETDNKRFSMYLAQIQSNTFNGSFEDYKNQQKSLSKNKGMTENDKKEIEEKVKKIESKRMIKVNQLKGG